MNDLIINDIDTINLKYTMSGKCREDTEVVRDRIPTHPCCKLRKQLYHTLQLLFSVYLYVDLIYRDKMCFLCQPVVLKKTVQFDFLHLIIQIGQDSI